MIKIPTAPDMRIALETRGNSNHQPVLLLHGGGQTRHAWGAALSVLAEKNYFAISADLRGHGDSDWAEPGGYTLEHFAGDIRQLCGLLCAPPVLVGASLGGLSSLLAVGHSDTPVAKGLILVDIVPRANAEGIGHIVNFMNANHSGFASLDEAADAIARYLPHRKRPTNLDGLQKNLRRADNGRYFWHWDPNFLNADDLQSTMHLLDDAASKVTIPTLLIKGSASDVVDESGIAHFRELIPHVEFREVQGATHMVAGDSNSQFNSAVLDFLLQLPHP